MRGHRKKGFLTLFLTPSLLWLCVFLAVPILIVIFCSFLKKGVYGGIVWEWGFDNYLRAFHPIYFKIFLNSFRLALLTAVTCLCIGLPMAYQLATASKKWRAGLLVLIMIPFWTNFIIRVYAIKVLLGSEGPVAHLGQVLGLDFYSVFAPSAVWIAMVTNYLPFMVLPIYVTLEKMDFTLLEAARDLGASSYRVVRDVLLPLAKPGILSGLLFVFIPALGEFIIPDLLGGARTMLVGNIITEQFLKTRDWPFGSALAVLLLSTVFVFLLLDPARFTKKWAKRKRITAQPNVSALEPLEPLPNG